MKRISELVFLIALTELCLGGGGRLLPLGSVSPRMVLFALSILLLVIRVLQGERIPADILWVVTIAASVLALGTATGLLSGADPHLIWEDVRPLLYVFALPFFWLAVSPPVTPQLLKVIRTSSLILAIAFFLTLIVIHSGWITFLEFWQATAPTQEMFFRGEYTFTYKGFVFLPVGILLFGFGSTRWRYAAIAVLLLALFLTFTRGFVFSLGLTVLSYLIYQRRWILASATLLFCLLLILFGGQAISAFSTLVSTHEVSAAVLNRNPSREILPEHRLGDREYSDGQRFVQVREVASALTPASLLWGHGFGIGTASKPVHMEISYMEILHKQGIIGLAAWLALLLWATRLFLRSPRDIEALSCYFMILFFYFQSLTNQYMNNPIGMSIILMSVVVLKRKQE